MRTSVKLGFEMSLSVKIIKDPEYVLTTPLAKLEELID
jgi:hypothetical protein